MAAVNVKIPDQLKENGDAVLRQHDLNATQFINLCYRYLEQHGRPPFITETHVFTPDDLVITISDLLEKSRDQLSKIKTFLEKQTRPENEERAREYLDTERLALTRLVSEVQQNGYRLESFAAETGAYRRVSHSLPRAAYLLSVCDFQLSEAVAQLPPYPERMRGFVLSLSELEGELRTLKELLIDTGLLTRPAPVREYTHRGERVAVTIPQPEGYAYGAWLVRLELRAGRLPAHLEKAGLLFPRLRGRVFVPGTVYGHGVNNPATGEFELGFRFISNISEFHVYSSGCEEADNETGIDDLAAVLCLRVEEYIGDHIQQNTAPL